MAGMADGAYIPDEPTAGFEYFRPAPLPRCLFPADDAGGALVLLADAPWLTLEQLDTISTDGLQQLALSPLELVVGGIASADSMLGQGRLADARDRFHTNQTRDEFGLMTVGLMYLETGYGSERRTYNPDDLFLCSLTESLPGETWRPWYAERYPTVPERWIQL